MWAGWRNEKIYSKALSLGLLFLKVRKPVIADKKWTFNGAV